jgi:hypothetical protein
LKADTWPGGLDPAEVARWLGGQVVREACWPNMYMRHVGLMACCGLNLVHTIRNIMFIRHVGLIAFCGENRALAATNTRARWPGVEGQASCGE